MASTNAPALNLTDVDLWDKVIDLTLITEDGSTDVITTPDTGRKPTIRLKGTLIPSNIILETELRVTNLYLKRPLGDYKFVQVKAGYRKGLQWSFTASVKLSYQELPGPDGVTFFQLLIGDIDAWTTQTFSGQFAQNQSLKDVMQLIALQMGMTLKYSVDPDVRLPVTVPFNGLMKDLLPTIEALFDLHDADGNSIGIRAIPFGGLLLVCRANKGMDQETVVRLDFVTHARKSGYGFDIMAPWVPAVMPESIISMDPKYFRQDFGGANVTTGNLFRVIQIDFDFCTTDDTNMMTLLAVTK